MNARRSSYEKGRSEQAREAPLSPVAADAAVVGTGAVDEPFSAMSLKSDEDAVEANKTLAERRDLAAFLEGLFASLYPDLPEEDGMRASRNERLSKGYRSICLTYGEVTALGVSARRNRSLFVCLNYRIMP